MLKQFYRMGSLENGMEGVKFALYNSVMPARIVEVHEVELDGRTYVAHELAFAQAGITRAATSVCEAAPIAFGKGALVTVIVEDTHVEPGAHRIVVKVRTEEFGTLSVAAEDVVVG